VTTPYEVLATKRDGKPLAASQIEDIVAGAASGTWAEAELAAFLMATAIRGMSLEETRVLTLAMLASGTRWNLAAAVPGVVDKHSTGGVGDKVSLVLAPLLAACGVPVAMLTGRALGHTGGTADKLETIPGLSLDLSRARAVDLLRRTHIASGIATADIAPADRRLYALRDRTATVESMPLVVASILSKKLATGAAAIVFDVKQGNGAFFPEPQRALELARLLVETCRAAGCPATALVTDMSQPLGRWSGHAMELREALDCLEGSGPEDLMTVTFEQCLAVAALAGHAVDRQRLQAVVASGHAREAFDLWAAAQGAETVWLRAPRCERAPHEVVLRAIRAGMLARVDTRALGFVLAAAGASRAVTGGALDAGVSLHTVARLGDRIEAGQELARLYLRRRDAELEARAAACFVVEDEGVAPELIAARVS
jgi:thymidine phosphorylase